MGVNKIVQNAVVYYIPEMIYLGSISWENVYTFILFVGHPLKLYVDGPIPYIAFKTC